jgi:hypothetical protein
MKIIIHGKSHPNILSTHRTTIEFTKEEKLTKNGNCIVAVCCDKSCKDLPEDFKKELKSGKKIKITIKVDDLEEEIIAYGSENLILSDKKDIVIRKSDFIDSRTLAIKADKSAIDLNRELVEKIKDKNSKIEIILEIIS